MAANGANHVVGPHVGTTIWARADTHRRAAFLAETGTGRQRRATTGTTALPFMLMLMHHGLLLLTLQLMLMLLLMLLLRYVHGRIFRLSKFTLQRK